jgi:hypothetical protein
VQRRDGALLVNAEDRGMHGRLEIQSDDVGSVLLKLRIITGHVAARTVGLKSKSPPHPIHGRLAEAKLLSQSIAAPMGRAIVGPTPGQFQNARFGLERFVVDSGRHDNVNPAPPADLAENAISRR